MVLKSQENENVLEKQNDNVEMVLKSQDSNDPNYLYNEMLAILLHHNISQDSSPDRLKEASLIDYDLFNKYAETLNAQKKGGDDFTSLKSYFNKARTNNQKLKKDEELQAKIGANRVANILETKNLKKANV